MGRLEAGHVEGGGRRNVSHWTFTQRLPLTAPSKRAAPMHPHHPEPYERTVLDVVSATRGADPLRLVQCSSHELVRRWRWQCQRRLRENRTTCCERMKLRYTLHDEHGARTRIV